MNAEHHKPMSATDDDRAVEARTLAAMCARANAARRTLFVELGSATPTGGAERPARRRLAIR